MITELEKLLKDATPGPWDFDYGVSKRTAWSISKLSPDVIEKDKVLYLDGGKNLDLDVLTDRVEINMDLILLLRNNADHILSALKAIKEMRFADAITVLKHLDTSPEEIK